MRLALTVSMLFLLGGLAAPAFAATDPFRIWDGYDNKFVSFATMLDSLSREQVVVVGEQHDSPATHRCELAIFDGLLSRSAHATLALEMFERDVQDVLDRYLAGQIDAETFARDARAWPNHETDYRPLIERAKAAGAPVVASNVPRSLAGAVARGGLSALDSMPASHRWMFARHTTSTRDAYRENFFETMKSHGGTDATDALDRFYAAQCLKDDTMAESVADWIERKGAAAGVIVHVNGAFHSDDNLGLVTKLRERLPKARIATVRIVPVEKIDEPDLAQWGKRADWVIFVPAP